MGELKFSDNYNDVSRDSGVDSGFQFEFYCERCNDTWRTDFVPYRSGQASGWLGKLSGVFGGVLGEVGNTVDGLAQAGWRNARDEAFKEAVSHAKEHFNRCARCNQYVCDTCWNPDSGLCMNCAPDVQAEIEAARVQGEIYGAGEKAALEGIRVGKRRDVTQKKQLVCPQCGEANKGSKFCPSCGFKLAVESHCRACGSTMQPNAKFCPECGESVNR